MGKDEVTEKGHLFELAKATIIQGVTVVSKGITTIGKTTIQGENSKIAVLFKVIESQKLEIQVLTLVMLAIMNTKVSGPKNTNNIGHARQTANTTVMSNTQSLSRINNMLTITY
jgi:hypothetical protein